MAVSAPAWTCIILGILFLSTSHVSSASSGETVLQLDGERSYVQASLPEHKAVESATLSVSVFVWPEKLSDERQSVFGLSTADQRRSITLGWQKGRFYFMDNHVMTEPIYQWSYLPRPAPAQWHHVAATFTPVDVGAYTSRTPAPNELAFRNVRVFVDGRLAIDVNLRLPDLTGGYMTLGMEYELHQPVRFLSGLVDDARIYGEALSAEDAVGLPFEGEPGKRHRGRLISRYAFNDISGSTIRDKADARSEDVANTTRPRAIVHFAEKVKVKRMPFDTIAVSSVNRTNIFSNELYTPLKGPLLGSLSRPLLILGENFVNSPNLRVTFDGLEGDVEYINSSALRVYAPPHPTPGPCQMIVANGGYNAVSFDYEYKYVLGEERARGLTAQYLFKGDVRDTRSSGGGSDDADGRILRNYGKGGPAFAPDRQNQLGQALRFDPGDRVEFPALIGGSGAEGAWSWCAWLHLSPVTRVLYQEEDKGRKRAPAHVIALEAHGGWGNLTLDGRFGAPVIVDAWQHVCIVRTKDGDGYFYVSGALAANTSAELMPEPVTYKLDRALLGVDMLGSVDDLLVWSRAISSDEVSDLYRREGVAVEVDGRSVFQLVGTGSNAAFDAPGWQANGTFTVEMWLKPVETNGTFVLFEQPTQSMLLPGVIVWMVDGRVSFSVMIDSAVALTREVSTPDPVLFPNQWARIAASYNGLLVRILVDGQVVAEQGSTVDGIRPVEASRSPATLGASAINNAPETGFQGSFGELRLWSVAIDSITAANGCPLKGNETGLWELFRLNEGVGGVAVGSRGRGLLVFTGDKDPLWTYADLWAGAEGGVLLSESYIAGDGTRQAWTNMTARFTAQLRNTCGLLHRSGGEELQVTLVGPLDRHEFVVPGSIVDNGDGTYSGEYVAGACGHYALRVESIDVPTLQGTRLDNPAYGPLIFKNSPARIFVHPGPTSAPHSFAYDDLDLLPNDDLATAYAGVPATFTLRAVDASGCRRVSGGDAFAVKLSGRPAADGSIRDAGDGTYTVSYMPKVEGPLAVRVHLDGEDVGTRAEAYPRSGCGDILGSGRDAGSPWCINVIPGSGSLYFNNSGAAAARALSGRGTGRSEVVIEDEDKLDLPGRYFTISAWVLPHADPPLSHQSIVAKRSPTSGNGWWLALTGTHPSRRGVEAGLYVGADTTRTVSLKEGAVAVDRWSHVAVTYDGRMLTIHVDGVAMASNSWDTLEEARENAQSVVIGRGFQGHIDDVRVILALPAQVPPGVDPRLPTLCPPTAADADIAGWWQLNDGAGDVVHDSSSTGAQGTLVGGAFKPAWTDLRSPTGVNTLDPLASRLYGPGVEGPIAGDKTSFTVDLVDICGLPAFALPAEGTPTGTDLEVTVTYVDTVTTSDRHDATGSGSSYPLVEPTGLAELTLVPPGCGLAGAIKAKYTPNKCGDAIATASLHGTPLASSPLPFKIAPAAQPDPATSGMDGVPGSLVAGLPASFTVVARDRFGCQRSAGGDRVVVLLTRATMPPSLKNGGSAGAGGPPRMREPDTASVNAEVVDNGDGTYRVTFAVPAAGEYNVDVGIQGGDMTRLLAVAGSPFRIPATDAPWRTVLLGRGGADASPALSPPARVSPATVLVGDDLYVVRGWAADKGPLADVWKYELARGFGADGGAWWGYRARITIDGARKAGLDGDDEVLVVFPAARLVTEGKLSPDCRDLRFVAAGTGEPVRFWVDPHPGCSDTWGYAWVEPPPPGEDEDAVELFMFYGNARAAPASASPRSVLSLFEDFDGFGAINVTSGGRESLQASGWRLAESCSLPEGDWSAFRLDGNMAISGYSLRVDAAAGVGGSLTMQLPKMSSYFFKASFYDSDAPESSHWVSPNFDDCSELGGQKRLLPRGLGVGVFTCTAPDRYAATYPWEAPMGVGRSAGWRALVMESDGRVMRAYVDGKLIKEVEPALPLDKIFVRGGGQFPERFESVGWWDNLYIAQPSWGATTTSLGAEEAVVWRPAGWQPVRSHGELPPVAGPMTSGGILRGALASPNGTVPARLFAVQADITRGISGLWALNLTDAKWAAVEPFGVARPPPREGASLTPSEDGRKLYLYGGRWKGELLGDLWEYDVADNAWQPVEAAPGASPPPRALHTAWHYKNWLVVFGGFDGGGASASVWALDLAGSRVWFDLSAPPGDGPVPRYNHVAVPDGAGGVFVYGGTDGWREFGDVWRYDVDYNAWVALEGAPEGAPGGVYDGPGAREGAGVVFHEGRVYTFGGHNRDGVFGDLWSSAIY
eukprot:jgi/Mesvir1/6403/Mv19498-RA.1